MNIEDRRKIAAELINLAEEAVKRDDETSYARLMGACRLAAVLLPANTHSVQLYSKLLEDATHAQRVIRMLTNEE